MILLVLCGFLSFLPGLQLSDDKVKYTRIATPDNFGDLSSLKSADFTRLDRWLANQVTQNVYPSLSVAIATPKEILHASAFGWADRSNKRKATPKTLYQQASVSKLFTATLATILHQRGVVNLDRRVVEILPAEVTFTRTPEKASAITLRHLATHSSGLQRSVDLPVQSSDNSYADFDRSLFYRCIGDSQLIFEPGTNRKYSNLGFGLLAHCLELSARLPFDHLLRKYVLKPAGLNSTFLLDQKNTQQIARLAARYDSNGRDRGKLTIRKRLVGSGGLVATPTDVARLGSFILRGRAGKESSIPSDSPLARSVSYELKEKGPRVSFGWDSGGTRIKKMEKLEFPKKNGGRSGVSTYVLISPPEVPKPFAVAVSINLDVDSRKGTTAGGIARAIMKGLLGGD